MGRIGEACGVREGGWSKVMGDNIGRRSQDERTWGVYLIEESFLFVVIFISTLISVFVLVVLPFALMYPLLITLDPANLIIVILLPSLILYGAMFASATFKKSPLAV